ncbi:MAG: disulfide bond formation protein DsbA [Verrucomicrobia bacterium]|nr:MAG: disulfide bond formation protein DsbA [Verrucomicrobiota bacterium]
MNRYAPIIIVAIVGLAAVAAGVVLYRVYKPQVLAVSQEQAKKGEIESVHVRGAADAPVTLEEFGDFQCPPCGALSEPLNQLEGDYGTKMRFVFRQFPLANHANAKPAAYAAEAAGLQGRFWEMHDLLYREQANWSKTTDPAELLLSYARIVGLNTAKFQKDINSEEVKERVAADQKRAVELGVHLTPTIFVNGKSIVGPSLNPTGLRAAVEAALAEMPSK